jgi:hypothetical protein
MLFLKPLFGPAASTSVLVSFLLAWPRTIRAVVRIGAVGLLFYAASFYTRDWRPVVAQAEQPAAAKAASRSKAEPRPLPSKLAELPTPVEPETTGALTRIAPAVPAPSATETVSARPSPAPAGHAARLSGNWFRSLVWML